MIDARRILTAVGRKGDAASATGSLNARLAELLARFSTTVAGRIDAALSSIAPASSALSTVIVSYQQGSIQIASGGTSNTASISSVNTAKAVLRSNGWHTASSSPPSGVHNRLALTNSTTVTCTRDNNWAFTSGQRFCVTEYK